MTNAEELRLGFLNAAAHQHPDHSHKKDITHLQICAVSLSYTDVVRE